MVEKRAVYWAARSERLVEMWADHWVVCSAESMVAWWVEPRVDYSVVCLAASRAVWWVAPRVDYLVVCLAESMVVCLAERKVVDLAWMLELLVELLESRLVLMLVQK